MVALQQQYAGFDLQQDLIERWGELEFDLRGMPSVGFCRADRQLMQYVLEPGSHVARYDWRPINQYANSSPDSFQKMRWPLFLDRCEAWLDVRDEIGQGDYKFLRYGVTSVPQVNARARQALGVRKQDLRSLFVLWRRVLWDFVPILHHHCFGEVILLERLRRNRFDVRGAFYATYFPPAWVNQEPFDCSFIKSRDQFFERDDYLSDH